jgi:hypothetical protein
MPMSDTDRLPFAAEALARLPLAEAVLQVGAYLWDSAFLADFFRRHAAESYQRLITFDFFVGVVRDALLCHHGSLAATLDQAAEAGPLPASRQACYGKLRRVPLALSVAFLRELTERMDAVRPAVGPAPVAASLAAFRVVVLDGKKLKRVAKRLLPCRAAAGRVFGGKLLVAWDPGTGWAFALAADPDGEANECRLVPDLLSQVRQQRPQAARLWVADRQFGDLVQTGRFAQGGDRFVVRRNAKTGFTPDPGVPRRVGVDDAGQAVTEAWGWLGGGAARRYVRQITLERRPEALLLVTDLTDAVAYPAAALLGLYRRRWGVEQVFQQVTEVFGLARFIGSTPEATVFQAAFCLTLYNLIQVVRGHLAAGRPGTGPVEGVSTEKVFADVREELVALHKLVSVGVVAALVPRGLAAAAVRSRLAALLAAAWRPRYAKAVNKKPRPQVPKPKRSGAHTSVYRLQQKHRQQGTAR